MHEVQVGLLPPGAWCLGLFGVGVGGERREGVG